ncbi:MAG TPA: hypothetical protein VIF43_03195 [Patescibacteria group bacterium]|jgi:hypothetical protein
MTEGTLDPETQPPDGKPDRELTEGSLRYDPKLAAEFSEMVTELGDIVRDRPGRLRRPDEYVSEAVESSVVSWETIGDTDLRNVFATEFECDTVMGLAIKQPEEFPLSQEELRGHAQTACRTILDLEAVARTIGEEQLAERVLDLAARYAAFYGVQAGGRTKIRQVELGLVRE